VSEEILYKELTSLGYPGYRVGTDGSVWSWKCKDGTRVKRWKQLKPWTARGGYLITRFTVDGVQHYRSVHAVILEAFVGPRPVGCEGCHNNNDPADNRLENLRWDTPKNNCVDRAANGFINKVLRGESHPRATLTWDQVREIRRIRQEEGKTLQAIATLFATSKRTVLDIVHNRIWKENNLET